MTSDTLVTPALPTAVARAPTSPSTVILSGECSSTNGSPSAGSPAPRMTSRVPLITSSVLNSKSLPSTINAAPEVSSFMFDAGINGSLARMSASDRPVSRSRMLTPYLAPANL